MKRMNSSRCSCVISLILVLALLVTISVTAVADSSVSYCKGEDEANHVVELTIKYGDAGVYITDTIVDIITEYDPSGLFNGSNSTTHIERFVKNEIRKYLDDPQYYGLITEIGFEVNDANKTMLTDELYLFACIYYDEAKGGSEESAMKLTCLEVFRFAFDKLHNKDVADCEYIVDDPTATSEYCCDLYFHTYLVGGMDALKAGVFADLATAHSYGDPTWIWADDFTSASAIFACSNCTYTQTVTTTDIDVVINPASCTSEGSTVYYATVVLDNFTKSDQRTIVLPIAHIDETEKDHKCDVCGETMGVHEAAEGKHTCDYCSEALSECGDSDTDHECDVCGEAMGVHEAAEGKHTCDYCGEALSECEDSDTDHECDVCGECLSECEDQNPEDEICDICGEQILVALWGDANGDGAVNSIDASLVLQYDVRLIGADQILTAVCDVNNDGEINSIDASLILQYDVNLIDRFPVEK